MDIRYELYGELSQMIAISGFYNNFKNPIELQAYNDAAPDNITPQHSPSANVYGVELEVRKDFGFISTAFANLRLNANVSVVNSVIEMRSEGLRVGKESVSTFRLRWSPSH